MLLQVLLNLKEDGGLTITIVRKRRSGIPVLLEVTIGQAALIEVVDLFLGNSFKIVFSHLLETWVGW